jgi:tetratricopeptide (TPR) repeat protein
MRAGRWSTEPGSERIPCPSRRPDDIERSRRCWYVVVLLVGLLLVSPRLAAGGLINAGSLALVQATLASDKGKPREQSAGLLEQARARFAWALRLNSDHTSARWGLVRSALALDELVVQETESHTAAAEIQRLLVAEDITRNSLLYYDVLTALNRGGRSEEVIELYESVPPLEQTRPIDDIVTLAYLRRGTLDDLAQARALRPGDLYTNYYLWQAARETGDVQTAAVLSDTLVHFPLEAVAPADGRLLDYAARVIPSLLEEGLWDRGKTLNVTSFLVWQHQGLPSVERLLEQLVERYPTEPSWSFYLAELYHRWGDLERADAAYRQVLAEDSLDAQTHLRLGMVLEAKSQVPRSVSIEQLKEVVQWYARYYALAPDDLLGLKRLVEACTALEEAGVSDGNCWEAAPLQGAPSVRADDRYIVAGLLDVPVDSVELGPNLVENAGFERGQEAQLQEWIWYQWTDGGRFDRGLYVGGLETDWPYEGNQAAVVRGLWIEGNERRLPSRAGFWYSRDGVTLRPNVPYVLAFYYRTLMLHSGRVAIQISDEAAIAPRRDVWLPDTQGRWQKHVLVCWNHSMETVTVRPLLRIWGEGTAWFDEVQILEVHLDP